MQMPPHCSPRLGIEPMTLPTKWQLLSQRTKPLSPIFQNRADTVVIDTTAMSRKIDKTFILSKVKKT
jgi:hypothetical protein